VIAEHFEVMELRDPNKPTSILDVLSKTVAAPALAEVLATTGYFLRPIH